jgi:hypothetical protein
MPVRIDASTDGEGRHCPRIGTVNLKDRLCNVEPDCRNRLHHLAPPNRGGLNSTHFHGAHAPVEEPSTASIPDSCTAANIHSITSSARPSSCGGISIPSSLAVDIAAEVGRAKEAPDVQRPQRIEGGSSPT